MVEFGIWEVEFGHRPERVERMVERAAQHLGQRLESCLQGTE